MTSLKYKIMILIIIITFTLSTRVIYSAAENNELTILFTNDLHDHYLPFDILENSKIVNVGGYARLKTAIDKEKETNPNVLVFDAGDYSMGTLFQSIYASHSPQLKMFGKLGYDVITFGNHEYDFRADGLSSALNVAKKSGELIPQIVQANVSYPVDENGNMSDSLKELNIAMNNYPVKDYTIIQKDKLRIGVFGITGNDSASKAPMSEVVFTDPIQKAKEIVDILKNKEKVDLIVCLSHSGTSNNKDKSEDEILAKEVASIDVIISGHSHSFLEESITVGSTIIASSGEYGKNLGVMKLSKQNEVWSLNSYELKRIDDTYESNIEITNIINEYKSLVQSNYLDNFGFSFDDILAKLPFSFNSDAYFSRTHGENTLGNFISDAYIYAVKEYEGKDYVPIDVSIVPSGTIRASFVEGNIRVSDVFNVSSLGIGNDKISGYPIISVYLTGKELRTACEVDASISPIMEDAQLFMSGLRFSFNPNRMPLNKVTSATLEKSNGTFEKIDDEQLYRVVVGLYSAQMLSAVEEKSKGILSIIPKDKNGNKIENFEDYIIKNKSTNNSELKEWLAIAMYASSFEKIDGVSVIPRYYSSLQGRKIVETDDSLTAIISSPNLLAKEIYTIGASILAVLLLFVYKMATRRKR